MNEKLPVSGKTKNPRALFNPPLSPYMRYLFSVLLVLGAAVISSIIGYEGFDISPTNLVMVYLLAVVLAAMYLGRGPAILTSILSVLVFDYFFVPPRLTLTVNDTEYLLTFAGLLFVGIVISYLTANARAQADAASHREAETAALYALSRDLAETEELDAILNIIREHFEQTFGAEAVIHLGENQSPHSFLLRTANRKVGVVETALAEAEMSPEEQRLLEAFLIQSAQAIERVRLTEQARQIKLLRAAEKLQNALLNSISHDLRTPLVSITGALTTLENDAALETSVRQSLVETAREEADRLNRLVGNLLDMTRLESGALQVKREPCDAQDLIGVSLGQMESRLKERNVRVNVQQGIPPVNVDFVLIVHALNNLLDNAVKYSPEKSPIEIQAQQVENEVQIAVLDQGVGIPPEDLGHVFDKFFRVQRSRQFPGIGLGLAICKGIIEAHGGRIWAACREEGGTVITVGLPMEGKNE